MLVTSRKNARHAGPYGIIGQSRQPLLLNPNAAVWCLRVFQYPPKPQIGILQLAHLTPPLLQSSLRLAKVSTGSCRDPTPFVGFHSEAIHNFTPERMPSLSEYIKETFKSNFRVTQKKQKKKISSSSVRD